MPCAPVFSFTAYPKMEEERGKISLGNSKAKEKAVCVECKTKPSKYTCPGCSIRSCSLPCVKAHKQRTGCTGKRDCTKFVPLSQFNDNLLLSDYNFLEETKRIAESARRQRTKLCGNNFSRLPHHLFVLRRVAADRKIRIHFLPSGMTRRTKNQSHYDRRKKVISWTIEWQFHSTNVVLIDHGVDENRCLYSVIEKHLNDGAWKHKLKAFCEEQLESLKLFVRKNHKDPKSPFRELDIKAPIRSQLVEVVVLEFPVITVFLPSHDIPLDVINAVNPISHETQDNGCEGKSYEPEGVLFEEDEIIEDFPLDPERCQLTKRPCASPLLRMPCENYSEEALNYASNRIQVQEGSSYNQRHLYPITSKPLISGNMDFSFGQGLIGAYSNDHGEMSPEDSIDYIIEYPDETGDREKDICDTGDDFLLDEELEDGEIFE